MPVQILHRVQASTLEELNLADNEKELKIVLIAKEMQSTDKSRLVKLLRQYRDVFARSFEDMKGLDLASCHHQINLHKYAQPVHRRYHLNLNYAIKVKEEIDKLL